MVDAALAQRLLAAKNPRSSSPPSNISDSDGLLSTVARATVDRILEQCPHEVGLALFRNLRQSGQAPLTSNLLHDVARAIFDRWGIGRQGINDGALYVMSYADRKHHLLVGRGLLGYLDHATRSTVLSSAIDGLRRGDVDAAIVSLVKNLVWQLRWGWLIQRFFRVVAIAMFTSGICFWFLEKRLKDWFRTGRQRKRLREQREEKLRLAWERLAGFENDTSHFCAPCVVCVEPLSTIGQDWMSELALCSRGYLEPIESSGLGLLVLVRLPPTLQRRVVGFLGPSLKCFLEGDCSHGAIAHGVELFKCSHVLHKDCASQWLRQKNSCPVCRMPDPRITALATVPAAFACAQILQQGAANSWQAQSSFLDVAVDVATTMERPSYTAHVSAARAVKNAASQKDSKSILASLLESASDGDGWGGGLSFGGGGTSGDW